jgi:hypothetical protein
MVYCELRSIQILTTLAPNTSALSSLLCKRTELALSAMFTQLHQQRGAL